MEEEATRSSGFGMKLVAGVVLLIAAWLLFKFVIGLVTTIATVVVVIAAICAVIWALRVL
jgi:UPF0716 family protein affecting phage T7 exclusion